MWSAVGLESAGDPSLSSAFLSVDKEQEQDSTPASEHRLGWDAVPYEDIKLSFRPKNPQNKVMLCNEALGRSPAQGIQDPNCCLGTLETEKGEMSSGSLGKDL